MKTFSIQPGIEDQKLVACPLCRGTQFTETFTDKSYRFVRCTSCALVYQNPQPVFEDLAQRYDQEYFEYETENEHQFFLLMLLGLQDARFDQLTNHLTGEKRFLDVGCATGMLVSHMQKQGWKETGVEICRPAAEYGIKERGVDIRIGTLEEAGFPDSYFDVVHCSHLIEHLTDPAGYVTEVFRILKPGGLFFVTTPNISGLQAKLFGNDWRSVIPDHTVLFSMKLLRKLLESAGFLFLLSATWGGLAVGTAPGWLKKPVDRLAKVLGFGDVMIQAAVKPNKK